jgi:hypothetical protein
MELFLSTVMSHRRHLPNKLQCPLQHLMAALFRQLCMQLSAAAAAAATATAAAAVLTPYVLHTLKASYTFHQLASDACKQAAEAHTDSARKSSLANTALLWFHRHQNTATADGAASPYGWHMAAQQLTMHDAPIALHESVIICPTNMRHCCYRRCCSCCGCSY